MLDQLNNLRYYFLDWLVICDLYLFHFTVLLNPNFNSSKSLISISSDKLTTGTYNCVYIF